MPAESFTSSAPWASGNLAQRPKFKENQSKGAVLEDAWPTCLQPLALQPNEPNWVLVKEFYLSYQNKEIPIIFKVEPCYGSLNSFPSQEPCTHPESVPTPSPPSSQKEVGIHRNDGYPPSRPEILYEGFRGLGVRGLGFAVQGLMMMTILV